MEVTPDIMYNHAEGYASANAAIKRKPTFTYKSPAMDDPDPVITLLSGRRATPQICIQTPSNKQLQHLPNVHQTGHSQRQRMRIMGYSPSLYHPFGKLALSLPPLNPSEYGLPLPSNFESNNNTKLSEQSSSQQPGNEMDETPVPTVSSIAAVAANEVRRAGTRRRRMGGFNVKRKRKEVDGSDVTYPAKRFRQSRLGNQVEEITLEGDTEVTPEPAADGPAERRRSTRTRIAKRRESSEGGSAEEQLPQPSTQYAAQGDTISEGAEEGECEDGQIK